MIEPFVLKVKIDATHAPDEHELAEINKRGMSLQEYVAKLNEVSNTPDRLQEIADDIGISSLNSIEFVIG